MEQSLQVLYRGTFTTVAAVDPFLLTVITGSGTVEEASHMRQAVARYCDALSGTAFCGINVLKLSAGDVRLDAEVRAEIAKMMKASQDQTAACALVVVGSNLLLMALRAALSVLLVASKTSFPTRVCSTVEEAIDWGAGYFNPPLDAPAKAACGQVIKDFCSTFVASAN